MTSQSSSLSVPIVEKKKRQLTIEEQQRRWGWIFLSPWLIGFAIFTAFPMVASLIFSFTDFKIGEDIKFIGLANWQKLVTDPITLQSLTVTFRFGLLALPFGLLVPLFVASLISSSWLLGKPFFRLMFYMPYMVPAISGVFIWQAFLNGQTGWLARFLRLIGIVNPPDWLYNKDYVYTGLILVSLWGIGNAMLTMMASMNGVPTELYEAASIDGAGSLTQWYRITLPMISPVIFYNLVLSAIGLMQYFIVPYILTSQTRANEDLRFINLHLYRTAFQFFDMGYASALAWFIFIVGLIITLGIFATSRRWVYYASGE